jgi:hypothetical protein
MTTTSFDVISPVDETIVETVRFAGVHRGRGVRPVGWPDAAENAAPPNGCRRRARPHAAVQ